MPWSAGYVIADKYELEAKLGEGGMGSVWRAHHRTLRSPVAIKLMAPSIAANQGALARFMREAQAAAALRSTHVVQTFDYGVHEGTPFIVMEMLEGETLASRLARNRVLPPEQTATILTHVARAVGKGHDAGIVHRDLKPDNVFICQNDDEEIAKVLDFGIAKAAEGSLGVSSSSHTKTGAVLGTPYYMSPEQAQGNKSVDWRSDLWSMAVIAYECTTGVRPFESDGLGDLILQICGAPLPAPSSVAKVPPGFDEWWAKAASRDPANRFQSARELAESLRTVLTGARATLPSAAGETGSTGARGPAAHAATPAAMSRTADLVSAGIPTRKSPAVVVGALLVGAVAVIAAAIVAVVASSDGRGTGAQSVDAGAVRGSEKQAAASPGGSASSAAGAPSVSVSASASGTPPEASPAVVPERATSEAAVQRPAAPPAPRKAPTAKTARLRPKSAAPKPAAPTPTVAPRPKKSSPAPKGDDRRDLGF